VLRKDYIQRQFEEFGKVLATILGFKKAGSWEEFERSVERALKQFTDLDMSNMEQLSLADFKSKLSRKEFLSPEQRKYLATLLFEKMNYYLENNNQRRYEDLKAKCLALYQQLAADQTHQEFDLDVHYKLKLLGDSAS
jgi:hypothetical protein